MFTCTNPSCRFWTIWESRIKRHCETTKECILVKAVPQITPCILFMPKREESVDKRKSSINGVIKARVPSGVGVSGSSFVDERAAYLKQFAEQMSTMEPEDVVEFVYLHGWGVEAPIRFRTIWYREGILYNYREKDEKIILYFGGGDQRIVDAVVGVVHSVIQVLKYIISKSQSKSVQQALTRVINRIQPSSTFGNTITVFDKLEKTVSYFRFRKKDINAGTLILAGKINALLRVQLKKTSFSYV